MSILDYIAILKVNGNKPYAGLLRLHETVRSESSLRSESDRTVTEPTAMRADTVSCSARAKLGLHRTQYQRSFQWLRFSKKNFGYAETLFSKNSALKRRRFGDR